MKVPTWAIKVGDRHYTDIRAMDYDEAKELFLEEYVEIQQVEDEE